MGQVFEEPLLGFRNTVVLETNVPGKWPVMRHA